MKNKLIKRAIEKTFLIWGTIFLIFALFMMVYCDLRKKFEKWWNRDDFYGRYY